MPGTYSAQGLGAGAGSGLSRVRPGPALAPGQGRVGGVRSPAVTGTTPAGPRAPLAGATRRPYPYAAEHPLDAHDAMGGANGIRED
jgi:hypothetical protein